MDSDWLNKEIKNPSFDENGRFAKGNKLGNRFSSENQPSLEARIEGGKKSWHYRKARQQCFEEMVDIPLPDGKKADFWKLCISKIHRELFGNEKEMIKNGERVLSKKDKMKLIMHLIETLMPEDKNFRIKNENPVPIIIQREDADL